MPSPNGDLHFFLDVKQKDELKRAFDLLDDKGMGLIDSQDIIIVARALGLHLKSNDYKTLIRRYDPQKRGMRNHRHFFPNFKN